METSFGRGTVCDLNENNTIAEVYYFIQGTTPCTVMSEFHGFLEPILEYEPLACSLKTSYQPALLLENGRVLLIKPYRNAPQVSSNLPIFFQGEIYQELAETC